MDRKPSLLDEFEDWERDTAARIEGEAKRPQVRPQRGAQKSTPESLTDR